MHSRHEWFDGWMVRRVLTYSQIWVGDNKLGPDIWYIPNSRSKKMVGYRANRHRISGRSLDAWWTYSVVVSNFFPLVTSGRCRHFDPSAHHHHHHQQQQHVILKLAATIVNAEAMHWHSTVMLCGWGVKADMVLFAGNTVWSISERVRGVCIDVLYKSTYTLLYA